MNIVIIAVAVMAILAVGVGLMLYNDHKQHKLMVRNGGRRY